MHFSLGIAAYSDLSLCVSLGHPTEPLAPKSDLWSEKTTCGDGIMRICMFVLHCESNPGKRTAFLSGLQAGVSSLRFL